MDFVVNMLSWTLILVGSVLMVAGGLGLLRLPDLYTRLHAGSVTDTGATMLLTAGLFLQALLIFDNPMAAIKLFLILFFTLFTTPTASHALAKTALLGGLIPTDKHGAPLLASASDARQLADSSQPDPIDPNQPQADRDDAGDSSEDNAGLKGEEGRRD